MAVEKKEIQKASDITPGQIAEWEKTYGKKFQEIEIPLDEDDVDVNGKVATFFLRAPSRNVINATAKYSAEKNFSKANDVMIKSCVLGGDMNYLEDGVDDDIYFAVLEAIGNLLSKKKARIKKR